MVLSRLSTGDTFFVALQLIIRVHPEKRLNYTSDVLCFSGSALQNFLCTETLTAKLMCLFGFYFLSCFIQGSVLLHFLIYSSDSIASAIQRGVCSIILCRKTVRFLFSFDISTWLVQSFGLFGLPKRAPELSFQFHDYIVKNVSDI
jgi:hypothetical protein